MIGFIKKDLAMIKSNFKLLGALIVVYAIMGLMGKMDISFILPFMCVMIMISSFSYDNYNKWDAYAITIPNGRENSVKSKYITTILMIFIIAVVTTILSFIISYISTESINYEQILITMFGTIFGTLLVLAFMYPIIYKFGVEKARIGIFLLVFGIVIIGSLLANYIDLSNIFEALSFLENYIIIILVIMMVTMVYVSYMISKRVFSKKEF